MPFPTYQFSSKRFTMRLMTLADKNFYINLHQDPITCQHVGGVLSTEKALQEFNFSLRLNRKGSILTFIITEHAKDPHSIFSQELTQPAIGLCALVWNKYRSSVEMGIYLNSEHFGQGIAKEVLAELAKFAFKQLNIACLMIRTDAKNKAMLKAIKSLPYKLTTTDSKHCWQMNNPKFK
ncbi:GNAT family N-acetyltransferase [Thalassomonas sp. M1454]|uniref:GNAT family N-acetyltransferase n=1 Tax=Thalassomonas sp. M1454 TaxID=2594477 RepID=UPI00118053B0|nr:GNAT family N-acetyltransferase [Thalassomonas sp. M1454]TRX54519.1 GNAT family N-acetyltransferase [Thalassomonas sp. M1454]